LAFVGYFMVMYKSSWLKYKLYREGLFIVVSAIFAYLSLWVGFFSAFSTSGM